MKQSISKIFYRNIEYSYKERWSKSATVDWLWVGVLSHTQTCRNLPGGWLLFGRSGGGIAASKIIKKYFRMKQTKGSKIIFPQCITHSLTLLTKGSGDLLILFSCYYELSVFNICFIPHSVCFQI